MFIFLWKEWTSATERKENSWWRQVMQKGHEREEQRLRQKGTEKEEACHCQSSTQYCVQSWRMWHISPVFVGCFNQLTYVLDENWICLEERKILLARPLPLDCVCVCVCALAYERLCVSLCASVRVRVHEHRPHQSQPIHNSNRLCFSHTSLSMQLTSAVPAYLMAKT